MTTTYLEDYMPPNITIEKIDLEFDLYEDHAKVKNSLKIKKTTEGDLKLLGEELELLSITLDGKEFVDYKIKDGNLIIENCPDEFEVQIVNKIYPQKNTQLSGLYRTNNLFCTQCEPEGFRRITFFPDRPDILTVYTTKIIADKTKYPILLSNGNLIEKGDLDNGRHFTVWHDPFKKPSYLFALVGGDLAMVNDNFTTVSGRKIDLRMYVEHGLEDKCEYALDSLKKALKWDEDNYNREYDLDTYMIVAVSDFNMGAMENKGLNIFNAKCSLTSPQTATDQDYAVIEGVIGHEYFHNWTGNRVTCRDWFQLSLKEGLTIFRDQEFSRDMNSRDVNRIMDVKDLRNIQFPEDAGSMPHPVRPTSYQEINNFYTPTVYNKGAEVIRMQQTLLGVDGFKRGMDLYFKKFDGKAVTIDDFVASMEEANNVDFTQFKLWYSQAGTPNVYVKTDYQNGKLTLELSQTCKTIKEEPKPFHIPVKMALFTNDGKLIENSEQILELKEKKQTFIFENLPEKPCVSLLRDFSAPVILNQDLTEDELLILFTSETNGYAKWNAGVQLATRCIQQNYESDDNLWTVSSKLISAYKTILLNESLDLALKAELLSPPSFAEVIIGLTDVDVTRIEKIRDYFHEQIGTGLFEDLHSLYLKLWQEEDNALTDISFKKRKLRNVVLWLLMQTDISAKLCQEQFFNAKNMTDEATAFALLVNVKDEDIRNNAIHHFFDKWQDNDLVIDKWFACQALTHAKDTLKNVEKLLTHPAFNLKNPNKCRALIGAFCHNQRNFHAADGKGYEFLTKILLEVDKFNPQIAARLATPFTRSGYLNKPRRELIQQQLQILSSNKLSEDLQELIDSSIST